jgi:hypothetical protein
MSVWEWLFLGILFAVFPVLIPISGIVLLAVVIGGATSEVNEDEM